MNANETLKKRYEENENLVSLRLFGPLQVENKYGIVEESRFRPSVSWLLLKYMVVNIGRDVSEEEMNARVWPMEGITQEALTNRLRLRRLREAIAPLHLDKQNGLVLFADEWFALNPNYTIETDEDRFGAIMEQLKELPMEDLEAIPLCAEALEIYRGKYLNNTYEAEWLTPFQNYYEKLFKFLLTNTLERIKTTGDKRPLALLCRRSATLMPDWEELHRDIVSMMVEYKEENMLLQYIALLTTSKDAPPEWIHAEAL